MKLASVLSPVYQWRHTPTPGFLLSHAFIHFRLQILKYLFYIYFLCFLLTRVPVESYRSVADQSATEIIIVRHGETEWNALHKMQGQADIDLNDVGRQQANAVADRLSREAEISAIYTSDLRRALDTANIIATKCGGIQVVTDQDLREKNIGVFQGQRYDKEELRKHFPQAYEALISPDQEIPGGGESRNQFHKRGTEAIKGIVDKHSGKRVVVVSHAALIQSLYRRACPGERPADVHNASIGVIVISNVGVWLVKVWNDSAHLSQTRVVERRGKIVISFLARLSFSVGMTVLFR